MPTVYAYEDTHPEYAGLLKVGYTTQGAETRVRQQYPQHIQGIKPFRITLEESAVRDDGTVFTDEDVHDALRWNGVRHIEGEWFECQVDDVRRAIMQVQERSARKPEGFDANGTTPEAYQTIRQQVGSQSEVARLLGVHVLTISARERGRNRITNEAILALKMLLIQKGAPVL